MATALTTEIYDSLKDHVVFTCGEDKVYDCWAPIEIKSILTDAHVASSVYTHPIETNDMTAADMWCSVSWDSAGNIETIGFNYMSDKRMDEYTKCINEFEATELRYE